MERHVRSRRARRRLGLAAALVCGVCGCVPIAPFERPADLASEPAAEVAVGSPATPPDLPEPGDQRAATPVEPATDPESKSTQVEDAPQEPATRVQAPADDPQQSQVRLHLQSFYDAYNARDWKRAHAHFWEGATISDVRMLPDQSVPTVHISPVTEFFAELERADEAPPEGFEGRLEGLPEVRTASNVAQAWCHFSASFGGPQESMSWRRIDAFTFVLHEGVWKISSLAQSKSFDAPQEQ